MRKIDIIHKVLIMLLICLAGVLNFGIIRADAFYGSSSGDADGTYESFDEKYSLEYQYINGGTELSIVGYDIYDEGTAVYIPSEIEGRKVTEIAYGLFLGCDHITSVTIPDTVTAIGDMTFAKCIELETINIPESVTKIGRFAFYGTKWLENRQKENAIVIVNDILVDGLACEGEAVLPENVSIIADGAFAAPVIYDGGSWDYGINEKLTGVKFNDCLKTVGEDAFCKCSNLETVIFNNGLCDIGINAFLETGLKSVSLPDGVTSIGANAFLGCDKLTDVQLPTSIINVGICVFGRTPWEKAKQSEREDKLIIEGNILLDGEYCAGDVVIPDEVSVIAEGAFAYNSDLTGISIPESVEIIPDSMCWSCGNIASVELSDSVKEIDDWVFAECTSLETIDIPSGVKRIGMGSFNRISSINVSEDNDIYSSEDGILYNKNKKELVVYPAGKGGVYTFPESVTSISSGAFFNCDNLEVVLSPNIKNINPKGFGVNDMKDAFEYTVKVTVPEDTDVSELGLENLEKPNNIVIYVAEGSVAYIYLKQYDMYITVVTYPASNKPVVTDGSESDKTPKENETSEPGDKQVKDEKSSDKKDDGGGKENDNKNDSDITENVIIGNTYTVGKIKYKVTSKTAVTFIVQTDKKLSKVTIPAKVKIIGKSYKVTSVAKRAFKGNKKLSAVTVGSNVKTIGDEAFMNCSKLKKVTVGKNVTSIGKKAFYGDKKINRLIFKGSKVKKIGKKALKGVPKKVKITAPKKAVTKYKKLLNNAK